MAAAGGREFWDRMAHLDDGSSGSRLGASIAGASLGSPAIGPGSIVAQRFRILRVLGRGGMGIVFLALHLELDRRVALKIVRDELLAREDAVDRLRHEARNAAKLRSEHSTRVLEFGRLESGAPYIVMEYLEGIDLEAYMMAHGPIAPREAVGLILQACEAVAEAHAHGIIHRDLKPGNLFLATSADGSTTVKVLDFGISKSTHERSPRVITDPRMVVGSPGYMSPEQVRCSSRVGPAADIWSLGAVLYEAVTGHCPFEGDSITDVYKHVLDLEPLAPRAYQPSVSEWLECVILRCLRKDPLERFAGVAELAKELSAFGPAGSIGLARRIARVSALRRTSPTRTATAVSDMSRALHLTGDEAPQTARLEAPQEATVRLCDTLPERPPRPR